MRIKILDPALSARGGHHFDYDRRLLQHFTAAGHEVEVCGASDLREDALEGIAAHGRVTRLFRRADPVGGEGALEVILRESELRAADLRTVGPADAWLWPSFRLQDLRGCIASGATAPTVACVHTDPGIAAMTPEARAWRDAMATARQRKTRITLCAIEPEMRERFAAIASDGAVTLLPQPVDGPPIAEPRAALRRIGFFGYQRPEKGARLLERLVERLVADGYIVRLQNSNLDVRFGVHPRVEQLGFVEDFPPAVAPCDLVVLPYSVRQYHFKGSGPLAECMAFGIPVTAPANTLPGNLVAQHRLGPLFTRLDLDEIYRAIKLADRDFAVYARNALRTARAFAPISGFGRYADAMLSAAGAG